jgi:pilus assembly protein TadC
MRNKTIALCTFIFGFTGGVLLAFALSGTNVVFPGLGLVVSGALVGFVTGAIFGAILGLIIGFVISRNRLLK